LNFAFLTIREVAERLRVCRATVYRLIDKGQLRALRVSSGAIRVAADAAEGLRLPPATPRRRRAGRS
jgi:excisionase family DNA binding protein